MRRLKDQMLRIVQHPFFALCRRSPQNKHDRPILCVDCHDRCICKFLPADSSVGICLMRPHRQHRIEHQYSLLGPFCQTPVVRNGTAQIILQLFININQRRRHLHSLFHREAQPVRLIEIVVRVLPQNHYLHIF